MLDLRKLRYFLTVAEELHFGRAALRLHLAQPPLTRQISALEAELGFKLFDRTSRTVTLTTQGRAFLPYARGVLEQVELAQVIAGKLAAGTAGQLALGYVSSIALSDLFSQAIQAFSQRFPDVQLTLVECASGSLGAQVADGRLDIGLSRLLPQNDEVQALSLGEEQLVAAGQGVALVPACTRSLMNKGVTYRPLVEVDACAQLLVLTPAQRRSVLVDAFLAVIGDALHTR